MRSSRRIQSFCAPSILQGATRRLRRAELRHSKGLARSSIILSITLGESVHSALNWGLPQSVCSLGCLMVMMVGTLNLDQSERWRWGVAACARRSMHSCMALGRY